jgi:hypothetical protein
MWPNREVHPGKFGGFRGGGGGPKDPVPCVAEKLSAGVYRLHPKAPLTAGEYAFTSVGQGFQGGGGQLWDFGVDARKPAP